MAENQQLATATVGGGCFWCTEAVFQNLRGVQSVKSGYAGGHVENPTYQQVCTATTGHAEVIQIAYDPTVISFEDLLEVFFTTHDPTTPNRQGNDVGTSYRSEIFYVDDDQRQVALDTIADVDADEGEVAVDFDGRTVVFAFGELDTLVPAYAATIHKSQGSEYPAVVIPVMTQHYTMLQRNLLYTGVTRGRKLVVLVGQKRTVAIAVKNASGRRRWSKLDEWLTAGQAR